MNYKHYVFSYSTVIERQSAKGYILNFVFIVGIRLFNVFNLTKISSISITFITAIINCYPLMSASYGKDVVSTFCARTSYCILQHLRLIIHIYSDKNSYL